MVEGGEKMTTQKLENLTSKCLAALIEQCGGSMEEALDCAKVVKETERQEIKNWFGWEEE